VGGGVVGGGGGSSRFVLIQSQPSKGGKVEDLAFNYVRVRRNVVRGEGDIEEIP